MDQLDLIDIYRAFHPKKEKKEKKKKDRIHHFLKCAWNILQDKSHLGS